MVKKISTSQMKQPFDRIETLEETGGTGEAGGTGVRTSGTGATGACPASPAWPGHAFLGWFAVEASTPWTANAAGEAGWIQGSNLDTAGPVRFWRIAATLYELTVGDSVEFGGL